MQIDYTFSIWTDIDYVFIVLNFMLYKICSVFVQSYASKIRNTVFSKIDQSNAAFLYMREFLLAYQDKDTQDG
jgi:hypothetical protein